MDNTLPVKKSKLIQNIVVTAIVTTIWVILCTLGFNPANEPIDSIAVIWPGAILHGVGAILLGGWGIVATVLSAVIVDVIKVGSLHIILGFSIPDLIQALIPAWYYRNQIKRFGWGPEVFSFKSYLLFATLIPNIVGAIIATIIFHPSNQPIEQMWFPFLRWLVANIPISLILGWPLLKCLGPIMAEEGLTVNGWWQ
ncbi:MAG: hypothetical protein COV45_06890 [Deltaproteobacteria bacterium CG11_big_fil_rev_8_21_14_0_20_47_16]|nr:MAG: hypothetical protein COV45_06890 [Deltaproteobacteria bacterium CG11_big_fil_rev_8_21_14_0_20_47_16]